MVGRQEGEDGCEKEEEEEEEVEESPIFTADLK